MSDVDLQRQIAEEIKPTADELAADAEAAKQRMQKIVNELSDAIRGRNAPLIKLHLGTLDRLLGDYAALVARGKALVARLARVRSDDERSKAAQALAALTKKVGEQQGRLDGNYAKLKEMQAMASKALGDADSAAARLTRAWADMEAFLATNVKLYQTRRAEIEALHQAADAAVRERDAQDLAKIQSRNDERKNWKPTISDINSRLIAFFSETGKELPESLREQFTRDRIKFNKTMEGLEAVDRKIDEHHKAIKALVIKPIDAKKAAEAMGIPKGNDAKVKKALEAAALEAALDALGRDLKLGVAGRELMNRLRKAKLL